MRNIVRYLQKNGKGFLIIGVSLIGILLLIHGAKQPKAKNSSTKEVPVHSSSVKKSLQGTKIEIDAKNLEKYLVVEAALLGVKDNISLYFKDVSADKTISIDPTRSWIPASVIKAYVAIEAFKQQHIGLLNFDQTVTIQAQNVVPTEMETGEFPTLNEGTQVTIRQLVEMMITQSDNTAYNTLLDLLDRRNITVTLRDLGITETVVGEKLNLDNAQFQQDIAVPGRQPNTTTAKDFATLFDLLEHRQIADSDKILDIFKRQKINSMIPALLPQNTLVAHKTGDWSPIYHDGGIIYKPQDPFVLVLLTNSNDQSVLAKMAKVAYDQNADAVGNNAAMQTPTSHKISQQTIHRYLAYTYDKAVLAAQTKKADSQVYVVQKGDTLWSISEKFYGDGNNWPEITRRNFLPDTASIEVGVQLIIPSITTPAGSVANQKFPKITAADLGVTNADVMADSTDVKKIHNAFIIPGSFFYPIKRYFEQQSLKNAKTDSQKVDAYLSASKKRLSEIKTLLSKDKSEDITPLLLESETDLQNATNVIKRTQSLSIKLLQVKQLTDLHYALFASNVYRLNTSGNKEQMVNDLYNFYEQNQQHIAPVVRTSIVANPIQQQPLIGTIEKVEKNDIIMKFDNGTTRTIPLSPVTTIRDFHKSTPDSNPTFQVGTKIAVIGEASSATHVQPLFILRNIPKDLPDKHDGTVLDVNPQKNTIEILNVDGEKEKVTINDNTIVKGKDTVVTVSGITPGSKVTVFGENQSATSEAKITVASTISKAAQFSITSPQSVMPTSAQLKITKTQKVNEKQVPVLKPSPPTAGAVQKNLPGKVETLINKTNSVLPPVVKTNTIQQTQKAVVPIIKATSITVTQNGSGRNVKQEIQNNTPPAVQNKPAPQSSAVQQSKPAPDTKQPETKSSVPAPTAAQKK